MFELRTAANIKIQCFLDFLKNCTGTDNVPTDNMMATYCQKFSPFYFSAMLIFIGIYHDFEICIVSLHWRDIASVLCVYWLLG